MTFMGPLGAWDSSINTHESQELTSKSDLKPHFWNTCSKRHNEKGWRTCGIDVHVFFSVFITDFHSVTFASKPCDGLSLCDINQWIPVTAPGQLLLRPLPLYGHLEIGQLLNKYLKN